MTTRVVAGSLLAALLFAAAAGTAPGRITDSQCRAWFHSDCNSAIAAWLPSRASTNASDPNDGTKISKRDDFVYGRQTGPPGILPDGPRDGSFFLDQPKRFAAQNGRLVYDFVSHIAFYDEGCCAGKIAVAAYASAPPIKSIVSRSLAKLHTFRGVALGMSPAALMAIYGAAHSYPIPHHANLQRFEYTTTWRLPGKTVGVPSCAQAQAFIFRAKTLILIQLQGAC